MKHLGKIALVIAGLGALCMILMLFGARLGIWEPVTGFGLYRNFFNPLAGVIAVVGLLALAIQTVRKEKRGVFAGGVAALFGCACLVPLIMGTINPQPRAAPIHDITTDTTNAPAFEVLDETRAGARNSLDYAGAEVAAMQAEAYPCLLYTSPSPRDQRGSRMPSSA